MRSAVFYYSNFMYLFIGERQLVGVGSSVSPYGSQGIEHRSSGLREAVLLLRHLQDPGSKTV